MVEMELAFLQLAATAYLVSALAFGAHVLWSVDRAASAGPLLLGLGFLVHGLSIAWRTVDSGLVTVVGFAEGLSFFAWLVAGAWLVAQRRYSLSVIGAVVSPLAFALTLAAVILFTGARAVPAELMGPWLPVHVSLAFLGNAVFALAFAVSVIYLVQENALKSHRAGSVLNRLPSLEQLDRVNFTCLAWGFPLLTLGIMTGGLWASAYSGQFWSGEPREIFSIVLWVLYAGLLQLRFTRGLRGRRASLATMLGFAILVLAYLAVNVLPVAGRHGGGVLS
jgi:cytochrome c-type biogenesis protein CcsB